MAAAAPPVTEDLQLLFNCSCLLFEDNQTYVNDLKEFITQFDVTKPEDLLMYRELIEDRFLYRSNKFPPVCLRLLFDLAQLVSNLTGQTQEVLEFSLRKFVDVSQGRSVPPLELLEEVLRAAAEAQIDGSVTIRRRNLQRAIDSGLGRSSLIQQTPRETAVEDRDSQVSNTIELGCGVPPSNGSSPEGAGTPNRSSPSPSPDSDQTSPDAPTSEFTVARSDVAVPTTRDAPGIAASETIRGLSETAEFWEATEENEVTEL